MKQRVLFRIVFCGVCFFSVQSQALETGFQTFMMSSTVGTTAAAATGGRDTFGFELGNGKRLIRNPDGLYGMRVSTSWAVGLYGKLTEVVSAIAEGTPRARLQINVVEAENVVTFADLAQLFENRRGWFSTSFGALSAVKREATLENGRCMLDARVFKSPKEVAVVTLESAYECEADSAYGKIKEELGTLFFLKE